MILSVEGTPQQLPRLQTYFVASRNMNDLSHIWNEQPSEIETREPYEEFWLLPYTIQ